MTEHGAAGGTAARQVPEGFDGPRGCGQYDLAMALDLANLVIRVLNTPQEAPARWPTVGFDYPHVYNPENADNVRVILHRGRVVCTVGIYRTVVRTPRGDISVGGINCLATHPDYRRHGLATAVMEDAHAKMRADGCHIALLGTRIQDWYRKLGWESAGRQRRFAFDRGNITFLPEPTGMEVTGDWRPHVAELCALHNIDSLVTPRTQDTFTLLAERRCQRVFLATRGGKVVAYAGVSGTSVNEYAGAPDEVVALLRAVFTAIDDPNVHTSERPPGQRATIEMAVTAPAIAEGLPGLLLSLGIPHTLTYLGMIRILDTPGLLAVLGIPDVELEHHASGWRLCRGGQALDVTERELVKLVFGPERFPSFAPEIFPVDFFQWPLDRV